MNIGRKVFVCYALADLTEIKSIAADIRFEMDAEVDIPELDKTEDFDECISPLIEEAEVVVVFISEASRDSELIKKCVKYSLNLNKRILPVKIGKTSLFRSLPPEFKFRVKPTVYGDTDQRSKFFAQLKAVCGLDVENGDNYGTLVHLSVDAKVSVWRYGKKLCVATPDKDNRIRLAKGTHKIDFKSVEFDSVSESISIEIESNDGETFRDVKVEKRLKVFREQLEKEKLEESIRKKVQAEHLKERIVHEGLVNEQKFNVRKPIAAVSDTHNSPAYKPENHLEKWLAKHWVVLFYIIWFIFSFIIFKVKHHS